MALNPVEQRLVELRGHWEIFVAQPEARLLIWQTSDGAGRMLQAFFEVQKHQTEYTTGDLFIVFDAAFDNSIQYSRALKEALAGQYEASREELKAQGIAPDWAFSATDFPDTASGFIRALRSFGSRHHSAIGRLVAVLTPATVTQDTGFASWLSRALDEQLPERLRLVVVDFMESPRLKALADAGHKNIFVDTPKIDALNIAQETFAQETTAGPAGVFRNYLIGLVSLVEKGTADQVKAKAMDAVAFARKQNWADQEVVIRMLLAGALLKEKRFDEAVKIYSGARQAAGEAAASGHPAGQQLVLQTWFGEAGAHLAGGEVNKAAECYDQAAVVAQKIPNPILAIEAFRMGAFCHARMEQPKLAVERGSNAFLVGEELKPDARAMTTLPLVAVDMLRALEPERVASMEGIKHALDAKVQNLLATAEQQAAVVEKTEDARPLRAVEEKLTSETGRAKGDAAQQVDAVAAAGSELFREYFSRARKLLGTEWPLGMPAALAQAPKAPEHSPEGVAAS
jgi:tetratricopeptide (TPR) repeat protein